MLLHGVQAARRANDPWTPLQRRARPARRRRVLGQKNAAHEGLSASQFTNFGMKHSQETSKDMSEPLKTSDSHEKTSETIGGGDRSTSLDIKDVEALLAGPAGLKAF